MKIRHADKRYQPRHGGTWVDDLQQQAAFSVVGVTGYFLHDDLIETARALSDGSPAGVAAAEWAA